MNRRIPFQRKQRREKRRKKQRQKENPNLRKGKGSRAGGGPIKPLRERKRSEEAVLETEDTGRRGQPTRTEKSKRANGKMARRQKTVGVLRITDYQDLLLTL